MSRIQFRGKGLYSFSGCSYCCRPHIYGVYLYLSPFVFFRGDVEKAAGRGPDACPSCDRPWLRRDRAWREVSLTAHEARFRAILYDALSISSRMEKNESWANVVIRFYPISYEYLIRTYQTFQRLVYNNYDKMKNNDFKFGLLNKRLNTFQSQWSGVAVG